MSREQITGNCDFALRSAVAGKIIGEDVSEYWESGVKMGKQWVEQHKHIVDPEQCILMSEVVSRHTDVFRFM